MKRFCALLMALMFVMTLLPAVSLAEGTFEVTLPDKTTYVCGEKFDTTGLSATFNGTDVTSLVVTDPANGATITSLGTHQFTVSFTDGPDTYSKKMEYEVVSRENLPLSFSAYPAKTSFQWNETLDPSGLAVNAGYKAWNGTMLVDCLELGSPYLYDSYPGAFTFSPMTFTKDQVGTQVTINVTFTCPDGSNQVYYGSYKVDVTDVFATGVTVDKTTVDLVLDASEVVTAAPIPAEASDTFSWSTTDATITGLTLDPFDTTRVTIKGLKQGSATVIVTSDNDSSVKATLTVNVTGGVTYAKIVDSGSVITEYTLFKGTEHKLTVDTIPSIAAQYTTWKVISGDSFIDKAAFEANGTIIPIAEGDAEVQASVLGVDTQKVKIHVLDAATSEYKFSFLKLESDYTKYWMVGDKFDPTGIVVKAYVVNETTGEALGYPIPLSKLLYTVTNTNSNQSRYQGNTVAGAAFNTRGTGNLTFYYDFTYMNPDGTKVKKTLSVSAPIYIYSERPFMVVIDELPYTTTYYEGEQLNLDGIIVKIAYTTDNFAESSPKISRYEILDLDTKNMPAMYDKITSADAIASYKDYIISYTDPNGLATDPAKLTVTASAAVSSISVSDTKLNFDYTDIADGTKRTFKIYVPANTEESAIAWATSNPKAASYTYTYDKAAGEYTVTVTALEPGSTNIDVRTRGSYALVTCTVVVAGDPEETVLGMKLDRKNLTMVIGSTAALIPQFTPSTASDEVVWTIDSKSEADLIDETKFLKTGVLDAKKIGTLTIRATTVNAKDSYGNPYTATCDITILGVAVDTMTIDKEAISLYAGSTASIEATVKPDNATDKTVAWYSSDETSSIEYTKDGTKYTVAAMPIVTVTAIDENSGLVETNYENFEAYCKSKNTDTYQATVSAVAVGGITRNCVITVHKGILIETLELDCHSVNMAVGEETALTAKITPANATNKEMKWTSTNPGVATVEAGYVKAVNPGVTIIICEATDGSGKVDSCAVQVTTVLAQSITVSPYVSTISEGATLQLTANLYPANVSSTKVTWSTSDDKIAKVDANGKVTGTGGGTAVIRATSADGSNIYGTAVVAVKAAIKVTSVSINPGSFELLLGDSTTLTLNLQPEAAADNARTWVTSDSSVVSIDAGGKVTGNKLGTANVTVKVGGKTNTITITVVKELSRWGEVINCSRRVNVRSAASGTSRSLGYAYKGDKYRIIGQTGNWYKIQYTDTKVGYLWYSYLDLSGTNAYVSNGTTSNVGTNGTYTTVKIVNCKEWCNVRSGPSTAYTKVGTAPVNSTYTFQAVEGDWVRLVYNGAVSYIYKDYCYLS